MARGCVGLPKRRQPNLRRWSVTQAFQRRALERCRFVARMERERNTGNSEVTTKSPAFRKLHAGYLLERIFDTRHAYLQSKFGMKT